MKRWMLKLAVLLILGAVVNVAVALWCALAHDSRYSGTEVKSEMTPQQVQWWMNHAPYGPLPVPDMSWDARPKHFGFSEVLMKASNVDLMQNSILVVLRRTGWPLQSFEGTQWWYGTHGDYETFVFKAAIPIGEHDNWILLRPIWAGFVINSIFYVPITWLLIFGPFTARRIIRCKRGLCLKCGYDLRGNSGGSGGEVCPECGRERESEG